MPDTVNLRDPRNLRGISKEFHPIITTAAEMQWTAKPRGNGGLTLLSPNGTDVLTIPLGKQDTTLPHRLRRDLVRKTPKHIVEEYARKVTDQAGKVTHETPIAQVRQVTDVLEAGVSVLNGIGGALGVKASHLVGTGVSPEELTPVNPAPAEPNTVVSERPFVAKGGRDRAYESGAILERTWSDGTKDLKCAWPDCDRTYGIDEVARMIGHRKAHRTVTKPGRSFYTEDHDATERRVKRLAREIKTALEAVTPDEARDLGPTEYAVRIAEQIVEKRQQEGYYDRDTEPLTPEQTIERIRALVAGDMVTGHIALEQRVAELSTELAEVKARADRAEATVARDRETLRTFSALAAEMAGGSDDEGGDSGAGVG